MKTAIAIVLTGLTLTACNGRWDDQWSFGNPSCAPDGSVVWYELPNDRGSYDGLKNSPANCPWNKNARPERTSQ